jgi:hypothetical protein
VSLDHAHTHPAIATLTLPVPSPTSYILTIMQCKHNTIQQQREREREREEREREREREESAGNAEASARAKETECTRSNLGLFVLVAKHAPEHLELLLEFALLHVRLASLVLGVGEFRFEPPQLLLLLPAHLGLLCFGELLLACQLQTHLGDLIQVLQVLGLHFTLQPDVLVLLLLESLQQEGRRSAQREKDR